MSERPSEAERAVETTEDLLKRWESMSEEEILDELYGSIQSLAPTAKP